MQEVLFTDLGKMRYRLAWDLQEKILKENVNRKSVERSLATAEGFKNDADQAVAFSTKHHLLFVEHPAVYTLGKSGKQEHVLISDEQMEAQQIEFFKTNRGGDITFHGPGQIVGYPLLDLEKFYTDIGKYLRNLEEVIILTMADYGLKGDRSPGETGVWLDPHFKGKERKICAMGVRCSRWITMHGFAFNVNTDLNYFNNIVPCGISDKQVTSLEKELGYALPLEEVKAKVKYYFEQVFNVRLEDNVINVEI